MGCLASKKPPPPPASPAKKDQEPQEDDEETKQLIQQIAQRIVEIRSKAEDYSTKMQQQVAEIENSKIGLLEEQPVRVNGIVMVAYEPEIVSDEVALLKGLEGQQIEILIREMGGWSYCRRVGDKTPGWLPADRVAELAQLVADHEVGDSEGLLNLKLGDVVEVISRHYSGWAQCRLWNGPQLPGSVDSRQIGWVTDAYLQDNRSEAMLASKWQRLVLQALEEVVAYALQLETYLEQAKPEDRSADPEWMEKCMQFCLYLGSELEQITESLSQHGLSQNATGKYATTVSEVIGSSEHELSVGKGARVLVIDAENADWAWCRSEQDRREGWLPRNLLLVEPDEGEDEAAKDLPSWIKVGERARWWSKSQKQFYDVNITVVDESARQVTVTFVQDSKVWKMVNFEHFQQREEEWLLHPFQSKAKELYEQLPHWVRPGNTAYWWSTSQHRVLPVIIRDVCSRTRQVKVAFICNKTVKKLVQFHELIDTPKECMLQEERSGHTWRKPRRKSKAEVGSKEAAEAGSQTEADADDVSAKGLGDIMAEMTQDIGDMMGPDDDPDEQKDNLRKALTFMGSSEFLQADLYVREGGATPREDEAQPASTTGLQAGTDIADAITDADVGKALEADPSVPSSSPGKKEALLHSRFSQSDEHIMEALEVIAEKKSQVAATHPDGLFDTVDKELLKELAPSSSEEGADAGTLDAEALKASGQKGIVEGEAEANPQAAQGQPDEGGGKAEPAADSAQPQASTRVPSPELQDAEPGEQQSEGGAAQQAQAEGGRSDAITPAVASLQPEGAAQENPAEGGDAAALEPAAPEPAEPASPAGPAAPATPKLSTESSGDAGQTPASPSAGPAEPSASPVPGGAVQQTPLEGGVTTPAGATSQPEGDAAALEPAALEPAEPASPAGPAAPATPKLSTESSGDAGQTPASPSAGPAEPSASPVPGGAVQQTPLEGGVTTPAGATSQPEGDAAALEPAAPEPAEPASPAGPAAPATPKLSTESSGDAGQTPARPSAGGAGGAETLEPAAPEPPDPASTLGLAAPGTPQQSTGSPGAAGQAVASPSPGDAADESGDLLTTMMLEEELKALSAAAKELPEDEDGNLVDELLLSPEELQHRFLEDLARQQEEADAAKELRETQGKKDDDQEIQDLTTSQTMYRNIARSTPLLREALRLFVPDSWDSEEEEKTGRKRPDAIKLASCWEILQKDFETVQEGEFVRIHEDFEREMGTSVNKIQAQEKDLKERLDTRIKEAEGKLDTAKVQEFRSLTRSVMQAAETAKEKREAAKAARIHLAQRKVRARQEALRKALGDEPAEAASRELLQQQLPDAEALKKLSPCEALAEVSATAASCFRALQVVALRPPREAGRSTAQAAPDEAWESKKSTQERDLVHATAEALPELKACLKALQSRLQEEKNNPPDVDQRLRVVATDEDKMGKEDKREFVMFEGQQEYDWERSIKLKMQAQMRRRDVHTKECLERVTRALHRRWRRQRDRDKARNMQQLAALVTAIDETQVALDKIRKEHLDAVEKEVEDLERERRRLQEQTRVLMGAALVVRQEKARINKAWYAEPREKRALTFQSLKTVRRLHSDMISFPVTAEFKQKHSVLLYSLRMLEGRLRKDCPYAKDSDIQEGPLEETPEHKKQMEEIDADFEEQLAADSDELRAISRSKAQRAMAREAAQRRQAAEDMLAPALKEASEALRRCERAARRTEIAEDLLRPLAALSAQLGAEAFRHEQLEKSTPEPATFHPKLKRQEASLAATLQVVQGLLSQLDAEQVSQIAAAPSTLGKEPDWQDALDKASQKWASFCKDYPANAPEEQETPRGDKTMSSQASVASTLALDDLEEDIEGTPPRKGAAKAPPKRVPPPPPNRKAPARPPSAGSIPPSSPAVGSKAQPPGNDQGTKKGAALLEKLDELSATMDRALGKNALKSTNSSSALGGRSLKPPGIGKGAKR
ncbi:unnamed protein product [Effrenium voratum]|uniref:SH3 domain-containing protein n=1 Tax=Effrenium voratum TaxID=2562239 RepID=A0AA36JHW3_9DINO|nr:unnamed protein product [Effrenium voratum]